MDEFPRFEDLTPLQMKAICNGCGPVGWGWLVPEFCFHEAGNVHDFRYWSGGGWIEKLAADCEFLINCLKGAQTKRRLKRPWFYGLSFVYFAAVVFGGRRSFSWGKRKTKDDLAKVG